MNDKEPLESSQQQKSATVFPSSLTSKQAQVLDMQGKHNHSTSSNNSSGGLSGHYQNGIQKGKLILPTAIWILLVVAGLCFLSLLSSLNKTISTLDTLVEIEQENAKLNKEAEEQHHQPPGKPASINRSHAERLKGIFEPLEDGSSKETLLASPSGWFSLPSWTSLEPRWSKEHRKDLREDAGDLETPPTMIKSLVEDMLRSVGGDEQGDEMPVKGSISISSSTRGDDSQPNPTGMLDFMFKLLGSDLGDSEENANQQPKKSATNEPAGSNIGSLVTANIDKVNININTHPDDDEEQENLDKMNRFIKGLQRESEKSKLVDTDDLVQLRDLQQDDMNSLDKSIDSLMVKLMDQQMHEAMPSHEESVHSGNILVGSDSHPMRLQSFSHLRNEPTSRRTSLQSLLMPHNASRMPSMGNLEIQTKPDTRGPVMMDDVLPPMFGRPQLPSFVIALDNDVLPGEHSSLSSSITTRQPASSPYEFLTMRPPLNVNQHRPPTSDLDSLFVDLLDRNKNNNDDRDNNKQGDLSSLSGPLDSLVQSLLQSQENIEPQVAEGKAQERTGEPIVFINGEPLISDKKQSLSMEENSDKPTTENDPNQVKELFNLFFGSPPDSKLVVAPQVESTPVPSTQKDKL